LDFRCLFAQVVMPQLSGKAIPFVAEDFFIVPRIDVRQGIDAPQEFFNFFAKLLWIRRLLS
jgi:hypothetical protein